MPSLSLNPTPLCLHCRYKWFRGYEALHFPDPMGMRARLEAYSLGLYPTGAPPPVGRDAAAGCCLAAWLAGRC